MRIATFSPISNGALKTKELPTTIKVLSFGTTETLDEPIHVNEKTKRVFAATQKRIGRERVPIDFNHNTVEGSKAYEDDKEPRRVAGYGSPVIQDDGIYLTDIKWTPTGEEASRDYEDLSPAPLLDERDNTVIGLHSVALCPAGAISDLHFYAAPTITNMKRSSMKLSAETEKEAKAEKLEEHLEKDIEEQEKGIEEDKEAMKDVESLEDEKESEAEEKAEHETAENDFKEQVKSHEAQMHGDDCQCSQCSKHSEYCLCDECSKDMKEKAFTRLSMAADPFGEIHKVRTMSAVMQPKAYLTEPEQNKTFRTFMDEKIVKMAAELNLPDASELEKRLKAWLAEWLGDKTVASPITGDPKPAQFSAEVAELSARLKVLEADRVEQVARFNAMEKQNILSEATKSGKVVPFSAEEIKEISPKILKSVIDKLPATVPMSAKTKVLSADGKPERRATISDSAKAIQDQVEAVLANS